MPRTAHVLAIAAALAVAPLLAGCIEPFKDDATPPTKAGTGTPSPTPPTSKPREVNDPPVARFSIHDDQDPKNETTRGFKGAVLVLNATNSTDPDGFIAKYEWEVYELTGGASLPPPRTHEGARVPGVTFESEGVKVVKLVVTDNLGAKSSTTRFYYRDSSYAYGESFHWTTIQEEVKEEREHKLPVLTGAAAVAARIVVGGGVKAEIALVDPAGAEAARASTGDANNVTVATGAGFPLAGDWTIKVTVTYAPKPPRPPCAAGQCAPAVLPDPFLVEASHDADYGIDGVVWYGERPAEVAVDDGHGHAH